MCEKGVQEGGEEGMREERGQGDEKASGFGVEEKIPVSLSPLSQLAIHPWG